MASIAAPFPAPGAWARWRDRFFRLSPGDGDEVVLRHSRIYILPSRRGFAMIATLAIMLLTSLNYALSLGFAVTFLLTGLVAAALLHAFRNLAGIEIRPLAASETFAGGRVAFTLSVCGGDRARESLEVRAGDAGPVSGERVADAVDALLGIRLRV